MWVCVCSAAAETVVHVIAGGGRFENLDELMLHLHTQLCHMGHMDGGKKGGCLLAAVIRRLKQSLRASIEAPA